MNPPKPERSRETLLNIALADGQRSLLDEAARRAGMPTSSWVRLVALDAAGYLAANAARKRPDDEIATANLIVAKNRLQVLLDPDQRQVLNAAAEIAGLSTSTWVRMVALREARKEET